MQCTMWFSHNCMYVCNRRAVSSGSLDTSPSSCPTSPSLPQRPLKSSGSEVSVWSRLSSTSNVAFDTRWVGVSCALWETLSWSIYSVARDPFKLRRWILGKLQEKFFIVHILLVVTLLLFCLCLQHKVICLVVLKVGVPTVACLHRG